MGIQFVFSTVGLFLGFEFFLNAQDSSVLPAQSPVSVESSVVPPTDELDGENSPIDQQTQSSQVVTPSSDHLTVKESRLRSRYFGLLSYAPYDLIIPSKFGFSFGLVSSSENTWEFEYLRGKVSSPVIIEDLGSMTDERYSIIRRSYFGFESFNLSYGLSYFSFAAHLGDRFLNSVSGQSYPSIDLIQVKSLGLNVGVGNRWVWNQNFLFGVDWASWSQPLYVVKRESEFVDFATDQDDKDTVDRALSVVAYFPRFSIFKMQLGLLF